MRSDATAFDVFDRVEAVIEAGNVDIVDIEQQPAVGLVRHGRQEFPLAEGVASEADIGAGVLQHQWSLQIFLDGADAIDHMPQRIFVEWQWQQIMRVPPEDAGPAEMIRDPDRRDLAGQALELRQVVEVEWVGAADR